MSSRAFAQVDQKVGKKGQLAPTKIPSVETIACPRREESLPHQIQNTPTAISRCLWCRKTWAELDAEVRAAVMSKKAGAE